MDPTTDQIEKILKDQLVPLVVQIIESFNPDKKAEGTPFDELGRTLRQRRKDRGLTVARLAELTGLSRGVITRLEHGDEHGALVNLKIVAKALGLSLWIR